MKKFILYLILALFAPLSSAQTFIAGGASNVSSASTAGGVTGPVLGGAYGSASTSTVTGTSEAQASLNPVAPQFTSTGFSEVTGTSVTLGASTPGAIATSTAATFGTAAHVNLSSLP